MNDRLSYESIIAARLEQLPPQPAMADAIWSRIIDELDKDLPNDGGIDSNNGPGNGPGSMGNAWWTGMGAIVLLVAAILYMAKRKSPVIRTVAPAKLDSAVIATPTTATAAPPVSKSPDTTAFYRNEQAAPGSETSNDDKVPADTAAHLETGSLPVIESTSLATPILEEANKSKTEEPGVSITSTHDSAAAKKPRGVSGLSQRDYRIVPGKKDSARNNNRN